MAHKNGCTGNERSEDSLICMQSINLAYGNVTFRISHLAM